MDYKNIEVSKKDNIGWVALNRANAANALSREALAELAHAFHAAESDDEVKVVVFTAMGKIFTPGADAKEFLAAPEGKPSAEHENPALAALDGLSKPIIAAVNGPCFTGGLEMILCCDLIVASEKASFTDAHARFGLIHGWGGSQRLPRTVGPMIAKEMMFTAQPITVVRAEQFGLVNRIVPAEKLEEEVTELARQVMANSSSSLRKIKSTMKRGFGTSLEAGLAIEQQEYIDYMKKGIPKEARARIQSFLHRKGKH